MHKKINSEKAPAAVGSYSQGILAKGFLFSSGQLGLNPATNLLVDGDAAAQAKQAMSNIGAVLEAAGVTYDNIIKTTILLKSIEDFAAVDSIYKSFLKEPFPARSCFAVAALPKNALVEIEVVAYTE
ncbi:MAG: RidA family protein [Eubacteriales bacterium]|nr:RidA family protein [Eubacteriales bacterium]MDD3349600.1 RidA family protein [Eubacteriales bacterium]